MKPRASIRNRARAMALRAAVAALSAATLPACGLARSVNGGLFAEPGGGSHTPVGGIASGHIAFGNTAYLGLDGTVRVTSEYAHGALGSHLSVISQNDPVGPYARLGFAPLAVSARDGNVWYAMNTSLEFGFEFPFGHQTHTSGFFTRRDVGQAWTVSLRGDLEYRPAQDDADVFLSLLFGFYDYDLH